MWFFSSFMFSILFRRGRGRNYNVFSYLYLQREALISEGFFLYGGGRIIIVSIHVSFFPLYLFSPLFVPPLSLLLSHSFHLFCVLLLLRGRYPMPNPDTLYDDYNIQLHNDSNIVHYIFLVPSRDVKVQCRFTHWEM